jgi:hypothetical protein
MALPAKPAELWQYLLQQYPIEYLLAKIREQLLSDMERAGFATPDLPDKDPMIWIPMIAATLQKRSNEQLLSLLYVIDLPEKWHQELMLTETYYDQLAEAIVYRELVKVYYKLHFSQERLL